jgi:hypothetical protein
MKFVNPLAADELDMQDIRGGQYSLVDPVRSVLRLEGLACLALACVLYQAQGFSWLSFAKWFLLPDLAILVYLFGRPTAGMWAYNLTHSSVGAATAAVLGVVLGSALLLQVGLIWFAHIGFDRALGYGLKFPLGFRVTHLGVLHGMAKSRGA